MEVFEARIATWHTIFQARTSAQFAGLFAVDHDFLMQPLCLSVLEHVTAKLVAVAFVMLLSTFAVLRIAVLTFLEIAVENIEH